METKSKPNRIHIQEQLERRILHGLACEWEETVCWADPRQQKAMQKPLISIRDMKNRLGYWSPRRREISIGRKLVMNHPWYAVLDVFHHEMAHQFAHQVFGAWDETAHGPSFRKACRILRANPEASGTYPPLDQKLADLDGNDQDRIMIKVKKLMALAQSKNRHEAEAAMAKAHELIAKYNIEVFEKNERRRFFSIFLGEPALRHTRDAYDLASLMSTFYFVKCLWIPSYVIEKGKMGRVLEITGTAKNLKIAHYVHDVVRGYIDSEWEKYNKGKKLTLHRKTDYAVGIIRGFSDKLKNQRDKTAELHKEDPAARALVKFEDHQLKNHFRQRYPRISRTSRRYANHDFGVFSDGFKSGGKLVISKGIEETGESGRFLPEK